MSTGWSLSYSPSFDNHNNDPDKPPAQAVRATTAATVSTAGGEGGTIIRIGHIHIHLDDGVYDDDDDTYWEYLYSVKLSENYQPEIHGSGANPFPSQNICIGVSQNMENKDHFPSMLSGRRH